MTRVTTDEHQRSPLDDTLINVQSQGSCRDSPFGCQRLDHNPLQLKVITPGLKEWVEKSNKAAYFCVEGAKIVWPEHRRHFGPGGAVTTLFAYRETGVSRIRRRSYTAR